MLQKTNNNRKDPPPPMKPTGNRFDIRHKETLMLFLREYFQLFFPDLVDKINFETARFLDKELNALFEETEGKQPMKDRQRIADALILVDVVIEGKAEQILIYWEHQGYKPKKINERVFHCFCGIYFKFRKPVFPIVMFTDPAKWRKPARDAHQIEPMNIKFGWMYKYQTVMNFGFLFFIIITKNTCLIFDRIATIHNL